MEICKTGMFCMIGCQKNINILLSFNLLPMPTIGAGVGFHCCLCVCLFFCMISRKWSLNLAEISHDESWKHLFWGQKVTSHNNIARIGLCTLADRPPYHENVAKIQVKVVPSVIVTYMPCWRCVCSGGSLFVLCSLNQCSLLTLRAEQHEYQFSYRSVQCVVLIVINHC